MTTRPGFGLALLAVAMAAPGAAWAQPVQCNLIAQPVGAASISPYNALLGADYLAFAGLRLNNTGSANCDGVLRIKALYGTGRMERAGGGELTYAIVSEYNASDVLYDSTTNIGDPIDVFVLANQSANINPRLFVVGGQAGHSGHYEATLQIEFTPDGGIPVQVGNLTVSTEVVPSAQANFVGYGNNATLDLGELAPGVTGSIGLQIRASTDVDVAVSSERRGQLGRRIDPNGMTIPYSMTVGGSTIDLGTGQSLTIPLADPVRGQSTSIGVIVGDFSNAPVGDYSDVVTFRISAR